MIGEQVGPTMPAAAALLRPALVRGLPWLRRLVRSPLAALGGAGLASWERAVVCASADAIFPSGGPIPVSGSEAGLVAWLDRYARRMDGRHRPLLGLLLLFVELSPLAFGPVRRRLTQLGPQEREQLFARAAASRVYLRRASFTSLRALLTMGYLDDRRVAAAIGLAAATDPFGLATSAPPAQGAPT